MCISYLTVARTRWSFARGEDPRQQPDGTDCAGAGAGFPRAGPGRGWRHVRHLLSYWKECQGRHYLNDRGVKAVTVLLTGEAVNVLLPVVTVSLAIYFDIFHLCYTFCYRYLCVYLLQLIDIYFDTRYLFGSNHYARYPFGYTLVVDGFFYISLSLSVLGNSIGARYLIACIILSLDNSMAILWHWIHFCYYCETRYLW